MANVTIPTCGEQFFFQSMLGINEDLALTLGLYMNNLTPAQDTTLANISPLGANNYTPVPLDPTKWAITPMSNGFQATYQGQVAFANLFAPTGAVTVYGFYAFNFDQHILAFAQLLSAPVIIPTTAPGVTVTISSIVVPFYESYFFLKPDKGYRTEKEPEKLDTLPRPVPPTGR
jgi:hypothetical protein